MKELVTLRGHKKEVCCTSYVSYLLHLLTLSTAIAWHPIHDDILVSGGSEGSIIHWSMPDAKPKDVLEYAHESNVWSLAFHPLGHLLVSASNDHTTRFWSRGRPGQGVLEDRFHLGRDKAVQSSKDDEDGQFFFPLSKFFLTFLIADHDDFVPGLKSYQQNNRGGPRNNNNNNQQRPNQNQNSYQNNNQRPQQFFSQQPDYSNNHNNNNSGGGGGGGGGGFIPGFGRGDSSHQQSSYTGPGSAQQQQQPSSQYQNGQGNYTGQQGGGGGGGGGMRRLGPLPSQMDSLNQAGGSGGGRQDFRRGGGGGSGGGGGGGRTY